MGDASDGGHQVSWLLTLTGSGAGLRPLSMANIRSLCVLVAVVVTFTIFTWMFVEQDKVRKSYKFLLYL